MKARHRGPTRVVFTNASSQNARRMPQNCSVPKCRRKVYVENGHKISYFRFPASSAMFRKWIFAIRRDLGGFFQVTEHTRVCSRHFKPDDFKLSFAKRKRERKPTAVPSIFPWRKASPVKRKSPTKRSPIKRKIRPKVTERTTAKTNPSGETNSVCATVADSHESGNRLASI